MARYFLDEFHPGDVGTESTALCDTPGIPD
jgi:hypothetical protein